MAAAAKVLFQKNGINFKTLVSQITLSANYATGGETIVLNGGTIPNLGAKNVTGPSVALQIPARVYISGIGYKATLTPTANLLEYKLQIWTSGNSEFAAGAYSAGLLAAIVLVEQDFATGQFDS